MPIEVEMTRAKALMIGAGCTTVQLARNAGISRGNLNMALNGHTRPGLHVRRRVADELGYEGPLSDLFDMVTFREV